MIDIFNKENKLDLTNITCHSGGATGADFFFEAIGSEYGVTTKAYSYKTGYHMSENKVEISDDDYKEGIVEINNANKILTRSNISKYMNLLARNWAQVKYSDEIFAIGRILKPGDRGDRGYYNRSKYEVVDGGTSYSVMMGINHMKTVYVFDQIKVKWYRWSYISKSFIEIEETPIITFQNFADIGTRKINTEGISAIKDVYDSTFKQKRS